MYAKACIKELRRVFFFVENVLDGLKWRQGPLSPVLYSLYMMEIEGFGGEKKVHGVVGCCMWMILCC